MRVTSSFAVMFAAAAVGNAHAVADEAPPFVYGYVQIMDNYIGRGLSQSVGDPSVQAEIDFNPGAGVYGNLSAVRIRWVDRVTPGNHVPFEVDGVLGYRWLFDRDGEIRAGILQMQFPGRYIAHARRPDTTEVFAFIGWHGLNARLNYDVTESFGTPGSRGSWYLDTNANWRPASDWNLAAHVGRRHSNGEDPSTGASNGRRLSYTDYKLSATRSFAHATSVTVAWSRTTADPAYYTLDGYRVGGRHVSVVLEKDF
ncbi:TorF family putative porin [Dokdonella sp.]|uniref:TorF family putative porin n=1 Tax=Dokdonella sp. TaxID=2291710 RepID=UPI002F3EBD1B